MVRNSKFQLKDEVLEKLFGLFFEVVGKKGSKDEFRKTMNDLLSPAERVMISKRIAIIYLLLKGIDYYNICHVLKVSTATVAKFRILMERSEGVIPTFERIIRIEKVGDFLEELFNTLYGPGTPGVDWKAAWRDKIRLERKKEYGI